MNDGLTDAQRHMIAGVLSSCPAVQKAILFGSRAMGNYKPASDIEASVKQAVELENAGKYDCDYSVLLFEYIPHKSLKDFKKVFLKAGEKKTVTFE